MIEIKNDLYSIGVLPEVGGSLCFLKYKGMDILRPSQSTETEANKTSFFPMLPYTSIIHSGHFPYLGITRQVPKNSTVSRFPIHGDAWREKLIVIEKRATFVRLFYRHDKKEGFPFSYNGIVEYHLDGDHFLVRLGLENTSSLPMPYGMGVHPFFLKDIDTLIEFDAPMIWYRGDDPILGHPYNAPETLNFLESKPVPKNGADISFGNWKGIVQITYPAKNLVLQMKASNTFRHLTLFAPKGKDFFCLEPVTNTPDAFNLASLGIVGTGIQSLGPKQSVLEEISFSMKGLK